MAIQRSPIALWSDSQPTVASKADPLNQKGKTGAGATTGIPPADAGYPVKILSRQSRQRGARGQIAGLRQSCRSRPRDALSCKHRPRRKQPLLAGADAFVVIEEIERSLAQVHDRDVGRGADIERAAVVEGREQMRGVDGGAGARSASRCVPIYATTSCCRSSIVRGHATRLVIFYFPSIENASSALPGAVPKWL